MALHYGLKDPTIHHIDKKTASWTEDQNKIGLLEKWVSFFSTFVLFSLSKWLINIWKDMQIILYMAQLPTYTDVARHSFYQTIFFLTQPTLEGGGGG